MKKTILAISLLCLLLALPACQKPCEHTYVEEITAPATCTASGIKTYTCSLCNDSYTEEISMLEHKFGQAFVSKKATCTEEGEKSVKCTACGEAKVVGTTPLADHSYSSKVTTAATCTKEGVKTFTCKNCSDSYTETIAKADHNYSTQVISKPTCTTDGLTKYTCKNCSKAYEETTNAKGHTWVNATCTKAKYCSSCNTTSGSALGHTTQNGTCGRCGEVKSVLDQYKVTVKNNLPCVIDSQYRNLSSSVEITDVQCTFRLMSDDEVWLKVNMSCYFKEISHYFAGVGVRLYDSEGRLVGVNTDSNFQAVQGLYTDMDLFFVDLKPGSYMIELVPYE